MFYVIQENVFKEEHYDMLIELINRHKFEYDIVKYRPFLNEIVALPNKMKSGVIDEIPDKDIIKSIIDNGYVNIIYDPAILIEESTFLNYVLNILWGFDDNIINTILNNIPRQLNPEEQEALKTYHEEWG